MKQRSGQLLKLLLWVLGIFLIVLIGTHTLLTPRDDRNWTKDQAIMPQATITGDSVHIKNVRNFSYTDEFTYTSAYYDKTYNLSELTSVDFILVPLSSVGIAHTFLSFGFANGDYVAVSIEVRKEVGEDYSALRGFFNAYELMYVVADERDLLILRGVHRDNKVFLYPVRTSKENMQKLFLSMLERTNALKNTPEFYNTATNNCTTNIVLHANEIAETKIPLYDLRILLPKYADILAYKLGLIGDPGISLDELRKTHEIQAKIIEYADDPRFSEKIRSKE